MNNNISYLEAIKAALTYAGLKASETRCFNLSLKEDLYYISFVTDWQKYECFVDYETCEVLGFNFEPATDVDYDSAEYNFAMPECLKELLAA